MKLREILTEYIKDFTELEYVVISYYDIQGSECFVKFCTDDIGHYLDSMYINIWKIFEFSLRDK